MIEPVSPPAPAPRAMPPPVPREAFALALGNIRQLLTSAKDTQDPKEVIVKAFQAIEAATEISERIVMSVGALEDKVETWETATRRPQGEKPLSESKCVGNLKSLGSDKAEFKSWNDKLINAMAQALGTGWRKFILNSLTTRTKDPSLPLSLIDKL